MPTFQHDSAKVEIILPDHGSPAYGMQFEGVEPYRSLLLPQVHLRIEYPDGATFDMKGKFMSDNIEGIRRTTLGHRKGAADTNLDTIDLMHVWKQTLKTREQIERELASVMADKLLDKGHSQAAALLRREFT